MTDTDRPLDLAEIRETFRNPTRVLDSLVRALADEAERLTIRAETAEAKVLPIPVIPYPGQNTQAGFYRSAAQNVLGGYTVGGSNVSRAVGTLLHSVADQLERSS